MLSCHLPLPVIIPSKISICLFIPSPLPSLLPPAGNSVSLPAASARSAVSNPHPQPFSRFHPAVRFLLSPVPQYNPHNMPAPSPAPISPRRLPLLLYADPSYIPVPASHPAPFP